MHNDDIQIGRLLSRREALSLFGAAGAALLVACSGKNESSSAQPSAVATTGQSTQTGAVATATSVPAGSSASVVTPSCVVVPALTEGPYFVDEKINRSDIRSDPSDGSVKPGTPLVITMNVSKMANNACAMLPAAIVDIWHCDAQGVYSDASDPSFNTKGKKFLRGYQVTDANGQVKFTTIYPGWYQGRAVHIHFKIRSGNSEFTSQFFFDETQNDAVLSVAPYVKSGQRLKNDGDSIYRESNGQTLLKVSKSGDGYAASFDIGMKA